MAEGTRSGGATIRKGNVSFVSLLFTLDNDNNIIIIVDINIIYKRKKAQYHVSRPARMQHSKSARL